MAVAPPPTPPAFPSPTDSPEDFDNKAYDCFPYVEDAANNVYANAQDAALSATNSANSATASANSATDSANSASEAEGFADDASASAASAIASPGTQATSTTSLTIGYGSKSLTLAQTGKLFVVGQFVTIASSASLGNWMNGQITDFNSGTGAMTVNVTMFGGAGTFSAWNIAQSAPILDSLYEIGDMVTDNERGSMYTRNGKTFLRTGVIMAAAGYPLAASDSGLMVNGLPSTGGGTIALTAPPVTNGAGVWIACYGNATNVLISTDNMQTWAMRAHNNANAAVDAVWIGGAVNRFVTFGNSNSAVTCSFSTNNGASFSAGGTYTPGVAPVANTVRAAADDTRAVMAWESTTTNTAIATTANGSSLTAQNASQSIGANKPYVACCPALGAARWMIGWGGTGQGSISTAADASTWANSNATGLGLTGNITGLVGGSNYFLRTATSNNYARYSGGSWSGYSFPSNPAPSTATHSDCFAPGQTLALGGVNWLTYDGSRVLTGTALSTGAAQGLFAHTTDGIVWETRQLTEATPATSGTQLCVVSGNGYLGTLPAVATSGAGRQYSANWLTSCDYVGKARPITENTNGQITPRYVRIA